MTLSPRFRLAARLEFDSAAVGYEATGKGLGLRFVDSVDEAVLRLCESPQRYRFEMRDVQRIRVKHFPYTIYYRVRGTHAVILAVFHWKRNPDIWRERA